MRPETDFVLERAAWPALLLESDGTICRANAAARHLFALNPLQSHNLSALLLNGEADNMAVLLASHTQIGIAPLTFSLPGGRSAELIAQLNPVQREGQTYFVAQLFEHGGHSIPQPATPPPAAAPTPAATSPAAAIDIWSGFADVRWPALLVDPSGAILRANAVAEQTFGARPGTNVNTIFSDSNTDVWVKSVGNQAVAERRRAPCKVSGGRVENFRVLSCPAGAAGGSLLQFFHEKKAIAPVAIPAVVAATPTNVPATTQAAAMGAAGAPAMSSESTLAHKQKLDCALQLARSVALDFNNALTSILGHTSLLLGQAETNHPWRNSLSEIEKSAAKAAEIANDLAAFSRQEKDTRVQTAGNLNALIERTIEAFQSARPSGITIARQLERKLFTASFDEAKMQQAFIKILENAAEAVAAQGRNTVQTRNMELSEPTQDRTAKLNAGNFVCVEISDNGPGIAEDVMPRIFEPFFTTKGSKHRGLGLAWVYGIVTNHGGGVAVSSQPEMGTSVRVYLPAIRKIVRDTAADLANLHGTQTVLLVDDEDLLLTMGQMVLSSFGYTVVTANNGQKALELFSHSKKKFDLVITDLVMPNMSGRELTEQLLKIATETRIIWSSGYVRSSGAQEDERYLQKPFTSQDLLRKVKQALSD